VEAGKGAMTPWTDDDQVGVLALGRVEQHVGGAGDQHGPVLHAAVTERFGPLVCEAVFCFPFQLLVVLGRDFRLFGSKRGGNHDLRVHKASESPGPAKGRGRRVGPVNANEHVLQLTLPCATASG